jgi:hypothetical protein
MSITLRKAQTVGNGVKLRGNNTQYVTPDDPLDRLFELDAADQYVQGTTLLDISGNGRHATIVGSPAWSNAGGGCFNIAADSSKYIEVPDSSTGWGLNTAANNPTASFSVWAKISAYGSYQYIAGWRGGLNLWFLILNNGFTTEARFDGGNSYDIGMDYSPYYDNWAQTTFVVDSALAQTRLYINGTLVGQRDGITGSFGSGVNNFKLGRDTGNGFTMNGAIGGAIAYSRALTQEQVTSEFNRTKSRYGV